MSELVRRLLGVNLRNMPPKDNRDRENFDLENSLARGELDAMRDLILTLERSDPFLNVIRQKDTGTRSIIHDFQNSEGTDRARVEYDTTTKKINGLALSTGDMSEPTSVVTILQTPSAKRFRKPYLNIGYHNFGIDFSFFYGANNANYLNQMKTVLISPDITKIQLAPVHSPVIVPSIQVACVGGSINRGKHAGPVGPIGLLTYTYIGESAELGGAQHLEDQPLWVNFLQPHTMVMMPDERSYITYRDIQGSLSLMMHAEETPFLANLPAEFANLKPAVEPDPSFTEKQFGFRPKDLDHYGLLRLAHLRLDDIFGTKR